MVTTRSQAKLTHHEEDEASSQVSGRSTHSISSEDAEKGHNPRNVQVPSSISNTSTTAQAGSPPTRSQNSLRGLEAPEEGKLGRGCRVSRPSSFLDEQYLAASMIRTYAQNHRGYDIGSSPRDRTTNGGSRSRKVVEEDTFAINRRYPQREAAKRALVNLRETLAKAHGHIGMNGSGDDGDSNSNSNSNSMGDFHFRNHPEIAEEIRQRRRHRQARKKRRDRGGGRRGSSSDEDEESASSSSSSSSGHERGSKKDNVSRQAGVDKTSSQMPPSLPNSPTSLAPRATRVATAPRRVHDADRASLDSSITAASLCESSVERDAERDHHDATKGAGSDTSSDADGDGTRDFDDEAERRRAQRNAKESVDNNVSLNFYMRDAVGVADPHQIRRRQLDRRYRWLVYQDETEARSRVDGTGGSSGVDPNPTSSTSATTTANGALGDITPLRIDDGVSFESVGGLPQHIVTLREMVLLPLLYPDLFRQLDLKAPRGVLFVGPPGTGKTLMARALANEGSRFACGGGSSGEHGSRPSTKGRPITFFVRRGADILSKWVGESERQLKLLFEEAKRLQPSIIFFDEVDGLAPTRQAKTEQTQAALVSTLLALMDGLEDRGQVVVIGATNRPDTVDPALRRPGRFDRELVFPLPDAAARRHILSIQLAKKAMPAAPAQQAALLRDLVEMTEGYSGADLGALCTEASLHRLRTALPQLYLTSRRLIVPPVLTETELHVRTEDFYAAAQLMQPSLRRCQGRRGAAGSLFLDPHVEVLLRGTRDAALAALAPSWSLVEKALRESSRDCQDMASAVRALCAVPIPQPPRPCLLVLREGEGTRVTTMTAVAVGGRESARGSAATQQRVLQLHHLAISVMKGLPGLQHLSVHLPQLLWDMEGAGSTWGAAQGPPSNGYGIHMDTSGGEDGTDGGGGYMGGMGGSSGEFTHMSQLVLAVRQCSPCLVSLSGVEEWLSAGAEEEEDEEAEEVETPNAPVVGGTLVESQGNATPLGNLVEKAEATEPPAKQVRRTISPSPARHAVSSTPLQRRKIQSFRYYMNLLADTDVIFLVPCASDAVSAMLFGALPQPTTPGKVSSSTECLSSPLLLSDAPTAVQLTRMPSAREQLHPQYSIVFADVAHHPLPADLRHFVEYIYRIVTMTLSLHRHHGAAVAAQEDQMTGTQSSTASSNARSAELVLREDAAPLGSPFTEAQERARRREDRVRRCRLWRKIEYRRLQLRHVLLKWVSQYINSGKFRLLASADLDLTTDSPLFKSWRQHTRRHAIGLQDILEKIEREAYVCLSQYHDDIDQLVRHVRTFFRTRSAQDQRYRLKALDLKETCLLHMYKMNRNVVRFCEETRETLEPSSDSDDDDEHEGKRGHTSNEKAGGSRRGRVEGNDPTQLVRKEDDPALIAERARRAVHFTQRPSAAAVAGAVAAPRKRGRRWSYGERRRRRKKTSSSTTAVPSAPKGGTDATVGEHAAGKGAAEDVAETVESVNSGDEEGAEDEEEASTTGSDGDVPSPEEKGQGRMVDAAADKDHPSIGADIPVEAWAAAVLSSLSYVALHRVFKSVMRGLEVEVRTMAEKPRRPPPAPSPEMSTTDSTYVVPTLLGGFDPEQSAIKLASSPSPLAMTPPPVAMNEDSSAAVFVRLLMTAVEDQRSQ